MTHEKYRPEIEREDMEATSRQMSHDLQRLLSAESIILDVGANRGQFAQEILSFVPVHKIYSFEPVPDAYTYLENIAKNFKQVIPIRKAISIQNGTASFYVMKSDVGSSLLPPLPGQPSQWLTLEQEVLVETIRLDDFIRTELIAKGEEVVSLLKSDAQGTDKSVLHSAGNYLKPSTIKSILVEINFTNFYQDQQHYYEIFELLDRSGYRMAWIYPHRAYDEWLWWSDVLFIGK